MSCPSVRTWTNNGSLASVLRSTYIDRVLVSRVELGPLNYPSFHTIIFSDHNLLQVRLNLGLRWLATGNSTCRVQGEVFPGPVSTNSKAGMTGLWLGIMFV